MALTDVQETLFFPLLGRAAAAKRWPQLFSDPWAEQAAAIHAAEGSTAEHLGDFATAVYGLRHILNVVEVNRYLADHPGAAVVNIGCGLDRLVGELDDPTSVVYNLDFPNVIALRGRHLDAHEREIDLPYPVTDHAWMDHVDASRGLVATAAGVFYYIEVDDIKRLVHAMGERFPGGRLCYDAESPMVTAGSEKQVRSKGTPDARMPFRVKDAYSVEGWSPAIDDVRVEYDFSSYVADRSPLPFAVRANFTLLKMIKGMYEVVVTFK